MKNLKKIGAVGGAISLALCWPLAVGQIGQTIIQDEVSGLDTNVMSAELIEYDRSYLSAIAKTKITVTDPTLKAQLEADGMPVSFTVRTDIRHGLTALSGHSVIEEADALPMTLDTVTKLNGDTQFTFAMDAVRYQDEANQFVLALEPSTLKGRFTMAGQVDFDLLVPALTMDFSSGEKLHFSALTGQGSGLQSEGYWLGKQSFAIDEVALQQLDSSASFVAKQISYQGDTYLNEGKTRLNSEMAVVAKTLNMANEPEVKDATFRFSLNQLDLQAFNAIAQALQAQGEGSDIDVANLVPQFDRLFDQGFAVAIDEFSMRVGEGKFNLDLLLQVAEGTSGITQDPMKMIPATSGQMTSFVSDALVEDYPDLQQGVDELLIMEMVEQVEGGYQLNAQVNQGNIVFANGQEVPIFTLLMPVLMQ